MAKELTYFSLFAGAGGLDIGFKEAGFKSLGASDIMEEAEQTFRANWKDELFIRKDIRELTTQEILKATNGRKPDIIIGGPPCQGFSVMGDKNSFDPRNLLFEHYVRIVEDLNPTCFVFENVKGLKTMFGGRYLRLVANAFASIGYDVYMKVVNAAEYGVPQKRERVIIVGTKLDKGFNYPQPKHAPVGKLKAYENVAEAIMDLATKGEEVPNHIALEHSEKVVARYKLIPEGGDLPDPDKLPEAIRRKNFGNTYTRLHRKRASPTMVPGNNAFPIHPTLNRSLTPREAARIQTFPDKVIFKGNRRHQCILVGNAVPPLLGAHVAKSIREHINGKSKDFAPTNLLLRKYHKLGEEMTDTAAKKEKELTFVDLFAGAGGIMIGMKNAGLKPLLCADFDKSVAITHERNYPEIPFVQGDLSDPNVKKEVLKKIGKQKVDLVVGGPPCQGFSVFGKRRFVNTKGHLAKDDLRNKLVFTFMDYVNELKPKWFLMENVPGLISMDGGNVLKALLAESKKMGYNTLEYRVINTADYGVPQKRKRFILIGNKTGQMIPFPKPKFFATPEDWQHPYRTVGQVITDLAEESTYGKLSNHSPMKHSEIVSTRMQYIEEGKKMDITKLPKNLAVGKNTKSEVKNYSHVYKRLHRNEPSGTLVPGHSAFPIHPWLNRQITVREAARIQTFPDDLIFMGSNTEQCRQVGNAFPPLAAEAIGNMIKKSSLNDWKEGTMSTLSKYSIVDVSSK